MIKKRFINKSIMLFAIIVMTLISVEGLTANKAYAQKAATSATTLQTDLQATKFKDIPTDHWAKEYIEWGVTTGLIRGIQKEGELYFNPKAAITEAEFAAVLSRYVDNIDKSKLVEDDGIKWSDTYYSALEPYKLPLKGYSNYELRQTGLTRARMAQLISAKNGFNLTERQAVYYMYENDLSNGIIEGQLTFESYGAEKIVLREQIPAFFYKLDEKGHTIFMGEPSLAKEGRDIKGIDGIPLEPLEVTDEMFDNLAKEKGINNPEKKLELPDWMKKSSETYPFLNEVAKKHNIYIVEGHDFDNFRGFYLATKDNERIILYYPPSEFIKDDNNHMFDIWHYDKNKDIVLDVLKASGKVNSEEIESAIEEYLKSNGYPLKTSITGGQVEILYRNYEDVNLILHIYLD